MKTQHMCVWPPLVGLIRSRRSCVFLVLDPVESWGIHGAFFWYNDVHFGMHARNNPIVSYWHICLTTFKDRDFPVMFNNTLWNNSDSCRKSDFRFDLGIICWWIYVKWFSTGFASVFRFFGQNKWWPNKEADLCNV